MRRWHKFLAPWFALILFVPPRRNRWADVLEMAIVGTILVAMLHLKVTYFIVGAASIVVGFVASAIWFIAKLAVVAVVAIVVFFILRSVFSGSDSDA